MTSCASTWVNIVMQSRKTEFSLRLLRETDAKLIALWSKDSRSYLRQADDEYFLPTVVAIQDDRIVGGARLWKLARHPTRWRLVIHVEPEFQRQGIGSALFNACVREGTLRPDEEITAGITPDNMPYLSFLQYLGFSPLMTTHVGTLSWRDMPEDEATNSSATIVTLAERPDLRDIVADLHERIYRTQHAWSPVGEITDQFKASVFLDPDELVSDAQFIAILGEQPVGISSLRAPFSISSPEMGWIGVLDRVPEPTGDHIHRQLFNACLSYARRIQGDIWFEVDEADQRTLQRCMNLDVDWEEPWLNLVTRVGGEAETV